MKDRYYGEPPTDLGLVEAECSEMMFVQYIPIKLTESSDTVVPKHLKDFSKLIGKACCDYIGEYGLDRFVNSYVYITAKNMFQVAGSNSFNREGWHSDGFMTDDINYVWCDNTPTLFNLHEFSLTLDDKESMIEMEEQASETNNKTFSDKHLLRLDQFNIHKTSKIKETQKRIFVKISISKDKYDLEGNAKNYDLDYDWKMRSRCQERNIPQKIEEEEAEVFRILKYKIHAPKKYDDEGRFYANMPFSAKIIRYDYVDDGFYKGDFVWAIVGSKNTEEGKRYLKYNKDNHKSEEEKQLIHEERVIDPSFDATTLAVKERQEVLIHDRVSDIKVGDYKKDGKIYLYSNNYIPHPEKVTLVAYKTGQEIKENIKNLEYIGLSRIWIVQELGLYFFYIKK